MKNLKTQIEISVANHFGCRRNLIVPNVSWGLDLHECDLLVLTPADYAYEIEIKISKSDLKRDLKKRHRHHSSLIKRLYFAIPEKLKDCIGLIPERAGVLIMYKKYHKYWTGENGKVHPAKSYYEMEEHRKPITNLYAAKFTEGQRNKMYHLGCMRIWGLKEKIIKLTEEGKNEK